MIILGKWEERKLAISIKPNCITLSIEDLAISDVYSYDYEGRPWTAMVAGVSHRRGLDGKTVAKWVNTVGERERRWLTPEESKLLAERARQVAADLLAAMKQKQVELQEPIPQLGFMGLRKASEYQQEKRELDRVRYNQIYLPVGILPPDQYGAVVLQATEGCTFNACTFCSFYKDRPFRIKGIDEFRQHCKDVLDFLGDGYSLRRTIFLGDANALAAPMQRMMNLMQILHEYFDVESLGGIYAFQDGVSGEKKTPQDYAKLASLGLERVYIGLESGSTALLRYLNKPSTPKEVLNTVRAIKQGGVSVGVIILLGAGGKKFARKHMTETVRILNKMDLDMDDIIYFSELIESEGMNYLDKAFEDQLIPLTSEERILQGEWIEKRLHFSVTGGTPHISRYDIREFVY